jgi:hypothetical protein
MITLHRLTSNTSKLLSFNIFILAGPIPLILDIHMLLNGLNWIISSARSGPV